jgi:YD repeat-containing protein
VSDRATVGHDSHGRVSAQIDGLGNITNIQYDSYGRKSVTIDPTGEPTSFNYE